MKNLYKLVSGEDAGRFIWGEGEPSGNYSAAEMQEAGKDVKETIEGTPSDSDYDKERAKKRNFNIKEISDTESDVNSYGETTRIVEKDGGKVAIEGMEGVEFNGLKEAIKTANLLNSLKETRDDYSMDTDGKIEEIGYRWNTTIYSADVVNSNFPTMAKKPEEFNKMFETGLLKKITGSTRDGVGSNFISKIAGE